VAWLTGIMGQGLDTLYQMTGSYGIAIILLTLVIKIITLPLTFSQTRMTKKMALLNPELDELKKKYKNNPEKLNRETVELWRKHNINPATGCLPMLLQLPFFIAFLGMLRNFVYTGSDQFLWLKLAEPDPYYILPVLAAVTTYLQMKQTTSPGDVTQKSMLSFMPVMIGVFSLRFVAGLTLYWVASNVFTIIQQYLVPGTPAAKGDAGK
jgi:YidC/Oxa1 family membrane protein insertase